MPPPQDRLPAPVFETLAAVAGRLAGTADPWWIIGSAAAAVHGLTDRIVGDIDVVTSPARTDQFLSEPQAVAINDGGNDIFRSAVFVQLTGLPLKVDVMGGLRVRGRPLVIATRLAIPLGENLVYVPARPELIRIFRLFGRPKDIARAGALAALGD